TVGTAPAMQDMFDQHGMQDLSTIPDEEWKSSMKILCWSDSNAPKVASVSVPGSLYDESSSMYTGQGILDTEAEDIAGATTLWVTAESEKCSFQYSLDGGTSWYTV